MITNRDPGWLRLMADLEHGLDDEDIRAVVQPKPAGESAVRQASYSARAVEDERELYI